MSATIITYANLGKKRNIPTADILPIIKTFSDKNVLNKVICQINTNFYFKKTYQAVPNLIRYTLRILEIVTRISISRRTQEKLFDFFAQFKIVKSKIVFFHGGYFLPRTFKKARQNKSICVDIARTAHFDTNAEIEKEEMSKLGFLNYKGIYNELSKECTHCNEFDYVVAMSDFVKESYVKAGYSADKIFVDCPDIDINRFAPNLKSVNSKTFKVLYMSYTQPLKGLHYLLEAWENLNLKDAELIIVGGFSAMPDELTEQYKSIIVSDPTIRTIENTYSPEELYNEASIFVLPSLTEGLGRVTLEAMACGLPVITTENARGLVEDGKSGFVVPIRDAQTIKEKIEYFYNNRSEIERMGKEARKTLENKKPFGETVYEIYQEILGRKIIT